MKIKLAPLSSGVCPALASVSNVFPVVTISVTYELEDEICEVSSAWGESEVEGFTLTAKADPAKGE